MDNETSRKINEYIVDNYNKRTSKELQRDIEQEFGEKMPAGTIRQRYRRHKVKINKVVNDGVFKSKQTPKKEYERFLPNGEKELLKVIYLTPAQKESPEEVLRVLGYDPSNWTMADLIINTWQQNSVENGITDLYQVKVRLKPLVKNELNAIEYLKMVKELFEKGLKPINIKPYEPKTYLDDSYLMFIPAKELHYSKLSFAQISEEYNSTIARQRFEEMVQEEIEVQMTAKCGKLLMDVGGDLFNSDNPANTTTRGTQMTNDNHWKMASEEVYEMYVDAIKRYRLLFNSIHIDLTPGNHDRKTSWHLFEALRITFMNDSNITFGDGYKNVVAYAHGESLLIRTHGDKGLKRLIINVPNMFRKLYAVTTNTFLFHGHWHFRKTTKEDNGVETNQIGTMSGRDEYEQEENYTGSKHKYSFFIFDENSMIKENIVNFDKKKLKIKQLTR